MSLRQVWWSLSSFLKRGLLDTVRPQITREPNLPWHQTRGQTKKGSISFLRLCLPSVTCCLASMDPMAQNSNYAQVPVWGPWSRLTALPEPRG